MFLRVARFTLSQRERAGVKESAAKSLLLMQFKHVPYFIPFSLTLNPFPAGRGKQQANTWENLCSSVSICG
jgi:hypothetical protein